MPVLDFVPESAGHLRYRRRYHMRLIRSWLCRAGLTAENSFPETWLGASLDMELELFA